MIFLFIFPDFCTHSSADAAADSQCHLLPRRAARTLCQRSAAIRPFGVTSRNQTRFPARLLTVHPADSTNRYGELHYPGTNHTIFCFVHLNCPSWHGELKARDSGERGKT